MANKKEVGFTLNPKASEPNGYEFIQTSGDPVTDPNIKNGIKAKKDNYYYMSFTLGDSTLSFDGSAGDVFLVRAGETCPNRGDATGSCNFKKSHMKFSPDRRTLIVRNNNTEPGTYSYRILIRDAAGPRDFDPVIINGGGGQDRFIDWIAIALGFGAGVGVMAVAYATGLLARIFG